MAAQYFLVKFLSMRICCSMLSSFKRLITSALKCDRLRTETALFNAPPLQQTAEQRAVGGWRALQMRLLGIQQGEERLSHGAQQQQKVARLFRQQQVARLCRQQVRLMARREGCVPPVLALLRHSA